MVYGTTFSPLQCDYLGIDYKQAFISILQQKKYELIRLGAYWNRLEKEKDKYDYAELDWLLSTCREHGVKVVLTVGMKAPRWPEYHIPQWVNDKDTYLLYSRTLVFIQQVMQHIHRFTDVIKYVQVENEPLHKFDVNSNRSLSYSFLKDEVWLVRKYLQPHQKVALTCGLSMTMPFDLQDIKAMWHCLRLADAVGFNVYVKMGIEDGRYIHTHPFFFSQLGLYRWVLGRFGKETFVAEMQDEPWEHGAMVHIDKHEFPSWSKRQSDELYNKLKLAGFKTILEWGCEWHTKKAGC